jgi:hypothetical protein
MNRLCSRARYLPENQILESVKEIPMQDRTCSKCGSSKVYKNAGKNWYQDGLVLQMISVDSFTHHFETEAFLCLDCRHLEIQVSETNMVYGDQKTLTDAVKNSSNWVKV